jgi:putative spermidine/putrescine transport system ATP-binding protein/putrescine transport system ATP-binding protein
MSNDAPTLELHHVGKRFGHVEAVRDVSLIAEKGQIIALLGPSGCGKTTTLRMIAGFFEPDDGHIRIGGREMKGIRPYERNVGLVFQDYALFPHLTVAQNIGYGLVQRGYMKSRIGARVAEMLDLVRLDGYEDRRPAELSGGQQQRVALARALAITPELMLLDEPLSALDARLRQELRFELKRTLAIAQCTALIVTHDQEEAMSLADHIVVMHGGRILQQGSSASIYGTPNSRRVADFIGRANWFDGKVDGECADGGHFLAPEGRFAFTAGTEPPAHARHLGVRPERLIILPGGAATDALNVFEGSLAAVAHLGAEIHYVIETAGPRPFLVIEQNRDQAIPPLGTVLWVGFRPADAILTLADSDAAG